MKKIIIARKALIKFLHETAKAKGITQDELSEKTGIQRPHISRFFAAETSPTTDTLLKIATALDVEVQLHLKDADDSVTQMTRNALYPNKHHN